MSGLKPLVGGSGIIVSGIGGAAFMKTNYESGTIVSAAVVVMLALLLWGGLYWSVTPYIRRTPKQK